MPDYQLRDAGPADIAALVRGRVRMFQDMAAHAGTGFDPDLAAWIERETTVVFEAGLGSDHFGWLVELNGGAPVASAMVTVQPWLPHPRYSTGARPYFHSVHTDPAHRGNGLARRLTERAIEWSRQRGFVTLALHASDQGRPIYERLGFVPSSEWTLALVEQQG